MKRIDLFLLLAIALAIIYMLFWDFYALQRYNTFSSTFFDIGLADYNLYVYSNYGALAHGLQYFVFMNHLTLFTPLLILAYDLIGNPFSFIWLQNLFIGAAAVVIYLIGRDVIKSRKIGIALGIAFLANPGVWSLSVFDAHLEGLLPFFYLISLYYYMKNSRLFIVSFILLLSIIDTGSVLALFFALGLLAYELFNIRSRKAPLGMKGIFGLAKERRIALLLVATAIAILFIAFYWLASLSLLHQYAIGSYKALPPELRDMNFMGEQKSIIYNSGAVASNSIGASALLWLFGILLAFGIGTAFALIPTIVFIAPWLVEVFIVRNYLFITPYMQYYAYAIGGVAGAVLGIKAVMGDKHGIGENKIIASIAIFAIIFIFTFLAIYPIQNPYAVQNSSYANVSKALAALPINASVLAQGSITPHLCNRLLVENAPDEKPKWFEPLNYTTYWFKPGYIIIDPELSDFSPVNSSAFSIFDYVSANYTVYEKLGSITIYKRV
ncbi:MAG: DUF2079 domain-containing protein [Candidatus Micrarchaeia archaeon]